MPPKSKKAYQQTYEETFVIEDKLTYRDINILTQITNNQYYFHKTDELNLQYLGVDFLAIPVKSPIDTEKYIFIDRKTSEKYKKREWLTFELYFQYPNNEKMESWSLSEPYMNIDRFMIVFIDEEQAISIHKEEVIKKMRQLEKERPELIKIKKETNKKGEPVDKYIISLNIKHKNFKDMKPKIYHKFYTKDNLSYFKRVN